MFLSKVELSTNCRKELDLDNDIRAAHLLVARGLCPDEPRFLYRDEGTFLLVQTHKKPNWSGLGFLSQSKEFSLSLSSGQSFRFRARLNVCKRKANEDKAQRSQLVGIGSENLQVEWLRQKSERDSGFIVHSVSALDEHMRYSTHKDRTDLVFRSVLFDGVLEVTDSTAFTKTVCSGFGRGKSFGFGLISLAVH